MADLIALNSHIADWTSKQLAANPTTVGPNSEQFLANLVAECDGLDHTDRQETIRRAMPFLAACISSSLDKDIQLAFEHVFRNAGQSIIATLTEGDQRLAAANRMINITVCLSRLGLCHPSLPVLLISDLFEMQTLDECEALFDLVESRVDTWKEDRFFDLVKNVLLRSCNDLLRRLSKSQSTVFCGRILVFLAKFFPLFERSGLNLVSEFNQDNAINISGPEEMASSSGSLVVTTDGGQTLKADSPSGSKSKPMDVDYEEGEMRPDDEHLLSGISGGTPSDPSAPIAFTYDLYVKLWSLQKHFRSPATCYDRMSWKNFVTAADEVLKSLAAYKLYDSSSSSRRSKSTNETKSASQSTNNDPQPMDTKSVSQAMARHHRSSSSGDSRSSTIGGGGESHSYFAKYLTSQRLLELQLGDSNFRHYIYIQFLILFQYLTGQVKFKQESQILTDEQTKWIKEATETIYRLIEESTSDYGPTMRSTVEHILAREDQWSAWKNKSCPPLEEVNEQANVRSTYTRKRRLGDEFAAADALGQTLIGNPDLNKLWNFDKDNWAACRSPRRNFHPDLHTYLSKLSAKKRRLDRMTAAGKTVEDSDRKIDEIYTWRALRLLYQKSRLFFMPHNNPTKKMEEYMYAAVDRVEKDRRGPVTTGTAATAAGGGGTSSSGTAAGGPAAAGQQSASSTKSTSSSHDGKTSSKEGTPVGMSVTPSDQESDQSQNTPIHPASGGGGGSLEEAEDISDDDELLKPQEGQTISKSSNTTTNPRQPALQMIEDGEEENSQSPMRFGNQDDGPEESDGVSGGGEFDIETISSRIAPQWRACAAALQFEDDEMEYFATQPTAVASAKQLLTVWKDKCYELKVRGRRQLLDLLVGSLRKANINNIDLT